MRIPTSAPRKVLHFEFNDNNYEALEGDSIAAALLASHVRVLRNTTKREEPRGLYCGIGHCYECRVYLDGVGEVRTCITLVEEGMRLWSRRANGIGYDATL